MAQYDLHLYQNSAESGVEFTEKVVAFGPAGSLLVSGAAGAITVLTPVEADAGKFIKVNATYNGYEFATVTAVTDALVFKGHVGVDGDIEIADFNDLATYSVGWTYRVKTAGTIKGKVCEIGDIITAIVARTGSGQDNADWTVMQSNLDGAVIGPASVAGNEMAVFDGVTGKLIKAHLSGAPGTMAFETATNYVAKAAFDAHTILYATTDDTPAALTVGEQRIVGRKTGGNIAALTGTEVMNVIWVAAPASVSASGTAGSIAYDDDYLYVCVATDTWVRTIMANWS